MRTGLHLEYNNQIIGRFILLSEILIHNKNIYVPLFTQKQAT